MFVRRLLAAQTRECTLGLELVNQFYLTFIQICYLANNPLTSNNINPTSHAYRETYPVVGLLLYRLNVLNTFIKNKTNFP